MSLLTRLKIRPSQFAADDTGSMPTEGVLASTLLIWWYVASFQFFDAYRQKNVTLKAAYSIADLISRQTDTINADYIEGLNTLFDYLTFSNKPTWVRVSRVVWDDDDDRYEVAWSYATGSTPGQSTDSIQAESGRIPEMPDGDSVIVVETNMAYEPIFNIGLKAQWYTTFITTRPRWNSCVVFDKEDGTTPACTYDSAIDPNGTVHVDIDDGADPDA